MPIKKPVLKPKPTEEEKEAATEMQAPSLKLKSPNRKDSQQKMRSLKDTHLDGDRAEFIKPRQLFSSYDPNDDIIGDEEDMISMAFIIHNAISREDKTYGPMVVFTIQPKDEDTYYSLSLSHNEERAKFVNEFRINPSPIDNCAIERIELEPIKTKAGKTIERSYWKIVSSDKQIPF